MIGRRCPTRTSRPRQSQSSTTETCPTYRGARSGEAGSSCGIVPSWALRRMRHQGSTSGQHSGIGCAAQGVQWVRLILYMHINVNTHIDVLHNDVGLSRTLGRSQITPTGLARPKRPLPSFRSSSRSQIWAAESWRRQLRSRPCQACPAGCAGPSYVSACYVTRTPLRLRSIRRNGPSPSPVQYGRG